MAVEDVTHLLNKEEGTAFDQQSILFSAFDDGAIFDYDYGRVNDINHMLDRDGKARTLEAALTLPIRSAPHAIRRGPARQEVADAISEVLYNPANNGGMTTPLNQVIAQSLGAISHRKAFFEKVLTERNGRIVYDKLAWRPPQTCSIKRDPKTAAFRGFVQMPVRNEDTEEIWIKPERAFVYIHGTHRNPLEGVSDMDIPYWCYQTKQKIRFLWYMFLETQSLPKTIAQAADQTSANKAARTIAKLRQSGVAGLEDTVKVKTLESAGRGASQFKEALQWLDSESSGSVLAGFTDLGASAAGGTGSFALSKDQTDFFLMSRQAVSRELQDALNQFVIPDLVHYNFGPNEPSPLFDFGPIAEDDAQLAVSLLQATAQTPAEQSAIPREFFDELIERVAGFLSLNPQRVRDGLDRARKEAEQKAEQVSDNPRAPQVAGIAGAVNAATDAVVREIGNRTDDEPAA